MNSGRSVSRRVGVLVIAAVLGMSLIRGTALAAPTITVQPTSQTGVVGVGNSVTLSVNAVAPGGPITYQWRKGGVPLVEGGRITGSQTATVTIGDLTLADFGSDYDVVVTEGGIPVTSRLVSISPSQAGPLNVGANGVSAAQINFSAFIESEAGLVGQGAPQQVTMVYGGVTRDARFFYLPNQTGSAIWVLFPEASRGDLGLPRTAPLAACGATESRITVIWTGATREFCVESALSAGASMAVEQVSAGSLQIRATMISPKFAGIVEPLVSDPYSVNFQVYDDVSGERIEPPCPNPGAGDCPGRPGWQASLSGATQLQSLDPLVLPAGSLGRRIRVGAVIYYYANGYSAGATAVSYAALSDPIFMTTGGDPSQWRRVGQSLPMPTSGSCDDVEDAEFAWGTNLTGGWQRAWEPWVNPEVDANGNRIGGWACSRVLWNRGGPWLIDNS